MTIAHPDTRLTEHLTVGTHDDVIHHVDPETGLDAYIAIHDTRLGPALGGTRFFPYPDEDLALTDALRLSRGMTYKAAAAGLDLGGGKAVIVGDPTTVKTPELLLAYGRFVQSLRGRYITAADVGTTASDLDIVGRTTSHVVGRTVAAGGSGDSGASTAFGVFCAMRAAVRHVHGSDLDGLRVGVEGAGKVGGQLIGLLVRAGAQVLLAEPNESALQRTRADHPGIEIVPSVLEADVDVYAPCALGATLTPESAPLVRARIVCGAANNQLLTDDVEDLLVARGITWVPDYVANAGGLIQVASELDPDVDHRSVEHVRAEVAALEQRVELVLDNAARAGVTAGRAAEAIADARLAGAGDPR